MSPKYTMEEPNRVFNTTQPPGDFNHTLANARLFMKPLEPKKREIKLESYVLAYLGNFLTMLEKGVEAKAYQEVEKLKAAKKTR